jgi:hypothetical protein
VPSAQNAIALENLLLETLYRRASAAGFEYLSTLIEARLCDTGPGWLREASVLAQITNYLRSGQTFAYLQVRLVPTTDPPLAA